MSWVSSVTLLTSSCEDQGGEVVDEPVLARTINAWLTEHNYPELEQIDRHYGGNKHPQIDAFGAGINHFGHQEDFVIYTLGLPWEYPEDVVLVIHPEDGAVMIYRVDDLPQLLAVRARDKDVEGEAEDILARTLEGPHG